MNAIDYEPFGKEWEKEMMKWNKKMLIDFLKEKLILLQNTEQTDIKPGIVRPASESVLEGEPLPAEGETKGVRVGVCYCNNTSLGQTECDNTCVDIDEY